MRGQHLLMIMVALLLVAPALAEGEGSGEADIEGWGVRFGLSDDPNQLIVGAQYDFGEITNGVHFEPNIEIGFGDDFTILSTTAAAHYHFKDVEKVRPYAGAGVALAFMVRCLTGVVKGRALFETIHDTPADELQQGWTLLTRILDYLVTLLPGHANIHSTEDLPTPNVLVPAVVYLARHDVKFDSDRAMRHFIHWMYAASTWARYTSQTDQRLDHDITHPNSQRTLIQCRQATSLYQFSEVGTISPWS